jgi:dihydroorotate dehydrogenase (fumarate)
MNGLATRYLGLDLRHPVVASASPLTATFDGMRRLEDAQAAAVVMASLYEEQIRAADAAYAMFTDYAAGSHPEAANYFPELPDYRYGISGHLETLRRAVEALQIPVIASLNGVTDEGWLDYAMELEQTGVAALELNLFLPPSDLATTGHEMERRYLDIVRHVKSEVGIPIAVKLPPFFSALGNFIIELQSAGADGVVLFNQFCRPDLDPETLSAKPRVFLSTSADIHLPLAWIMLLSHHVDLSLAAGTGVDTHVEVVKYLLAGADVATAASTLLRYGPDRLATLVEGLERWLSDSPFASVDDMRGRLDCAHSGPPDKFFRNVYLHGISDYPAPEFAPRNGEDERSIGAIG